MEAPKPNPIALRLFKVLGSNYDDQATQDALATLSKLYPGTDSNVHSDSTATRARKNLRRDLDTRLAEGSTKFLKAFEAVDEKLSVVESFVSDMHKRCEEAEAQLRSTNDACSSLLSRANGLQSERHQVEQRQMLLTSFLQHFTLSNEEDAALESRDIPVGKLLFGALSRAEKIRGDCQLLLSGEDESSRAGLDIMSRTSERLDQGYSKMHRWCITEFRKFGNDPYPEVTPTLREAVKLLAKRPELLEDALSSLAETRQTTLLQRFITALTRGSPDGAPRPIELHAHDPVRYVGDMLAWIHQAIAWEHEFSESLFDIKSRPRMMGSVRAFPQGKLDDEDVQGRLWVSRLMDAAVGGLSKPLQLRVLQTIKSQERSVISYKITNILQFYTITMRRTIGHQAALCQTLDELYDTSFKAFFETVEAQGRSLLRFLHPPDADLSLPLALLDTSQTLKEMMTVYESSLLGDEDDDEKSEGFRRILEASVTPILEMCQKMAALNVSKDHLRDKWSRCIFLLNCFAYLAGILRQYAFTADQITQIEAVIEEQTQSLVEQHALRLISDSGLQTILDAIQTKDDSTPLSHTEAASGPAITKVLSRFSNFLTGLDVVSSSELILLSVPGLSATVHRESLRRVGRAYLTICQEVRRPENKFEFAGTLLGSHRPFGQMSTLWQILGVQE